MFLRCPLASSRALHGVGWLQVPEEVSVCFATMVGRVAEIDRSTWGSPSGSSFGGLLSMTIGSDATSIQWELWKDGRRM